ncbi:MAG TPA: hypothetical protein VKU00_31535 [Chthonomonadaceae bacterium]|nr:hypothetical protein [Chthonomonadaceae bacterium]
MKREGVLIPTNDVKGFGYVPIVDEDAAAALSPQALEEARTMNRRVEVWVRHP